MSKLYRLKVLLTVVDFVRSNAKAIAEHIALAPEEDRDSLREVSRLSSRLADAANLSLTFEDALYVLAESDNADALDPRTTRVESIDDFEQLVIDQARQAFFFDVSDRLGRLYSEMLHAYDTGSSRVKEGQDEEDAEVTAAQKAVMAEVAAVTTDIAAEEPLAAQQALIQQWYLAARDYDGFLTPKFGLVESQIDDRIGAGFANEKLRALLEADLEVGRLAAAYQDVLGADVEAVERYYWDRFGALPVASTRAVLNPIADTLDAVAAKLTEGDTIEDVEGVAEAVADAAVRLRSLRKSRLV